AAEPRRVSVRGNNPAAIAEDDVTAPAGIDNVAIPATNDDIVAHAGRDRVDPAVESGRKSRDEIDVRRVVVRTGGGAIALDAHVVDCAVVAYDRVVAVTRIDRVAGMAADDRVVARTGRDFIHPAVAKGNRFDP